MQVTDIRTICVCGAGTMGRGIAQVCAAAGFNTILYEVNATVLAGAEQQLNNDLEMLVNKQKITTDKKAAMLGNLRFTSDLQQCKAEVIVEAVVEVQEIKINLLNQLAAINDSNTILASNTSSLPLSAIAEAVDGSHRVAGLHFFNPAPLMKLVEVVRAQQTSEEVIQLLVQLTQLLQKVPVVCTDAPGFIVNRVARPYYIEALRMAEENMGDAAVIDRLLESRGFKLGPFRLMDLIGNDINYAVSCSVYEQLERPERLKPSFIQKQKVERGELGRKTKQGYYSY